MFWLKQCAKCQGDLYDERDEQGVRSIQCLQCGRICTVAEEQQLLQLSFPAGGSFGWAA